MNPLEGLIGAFISGKGCGKGGHVADTMAAQQPPNPLENLLGAFQASPPQSPLGLLGAFLQRKGSGKGVIDTPAAPVPAAVSAAGDQAQTEAFEQSVNALLDMGIASDRDVAQQLLMQHGDVSAVVNALVDGS